MLVSLILGKRHAMKVMHLMWLQHYHCHVSDWGSQYLVLRHADKPLNALKQLLCHSLRSRPIIVTFHDMP